MLRIGFSTVKGTRHLERASVALAPYGPVGDRMFAVADLASGRVLRTSAHGILMTCRAEYVDGMLAMHIGNQTHSGRGEGVGDVIELDYWGRSAPSKVVPGSWNVALSELLGLEVTLVRMLRPGDCVYGGPVSIGEVERIGERMGYDLDPARFRATFVLDTPEDPHAWIGRRIRLGGAIVKVMGAMERCTVINCEPATGIETRKVTRELTSSATVGVDAVVTRPGPVQTGTVAHRV